MSDTSGAASAGSPDDDRAALVFGLDLLALPVLEGQLHARELGEARGRDAPGRVGHEDEETAVLAKCGVGLRSEPPDLVAGGRLGVPVEARKRGEEGAVGLGCAGERAAGSALWAGRRDPGDPGLRLLDDGELLVRHPGDAGDVISRVGCDEATSGDLSRVGEPADGSRIAVANSVVGFEAFVRTRQRPAARVAASHGHQRDHGGRGGDGGRREAWGPPSGTCRPPALIARRLLARPDDLVPSWTCCPLYLCSGGRPALTSSCCRPGRPAA